MTVATQVQPNFTTMLAAAYKAAIDAITAVHNRIGGNFAPHENNSGSPAPDLTVRVDAGFIWDGTNVKEKPAQQVSGFTIPSAGQHRIDRIVIDAVTGDARRIAGTAAAGSPSAAAPAIPVGSLPCCQILIISSDTAITNDMITDERVQSTTVGFAAGTVMLFQQTAAPTGWTKSTTHNDKALRIVSGTASSGGATAFSSVFGAGKTTGSTVLTTAHLPASGLSVPGLSVPGLSIPSLSVTGNIATVAGSGGGLTSNITTSAINDGTITNNQALVSGATGTGTTGTGTTGTGTTGNMGTGGGHTHTESLDLQFVDCIAAVKD